MAPGNRHRRAHADGPRSSRALERCTGCALPHWCTISARATPRANGRRMRDTKSAASSSSRRCAQRLRLPADYRELGHHRGAIPRQCASRIRARAQDHPGFAGKDGCLQAAGTLHAGAARLRSGLARTLGLEANPYPQRNYLQAARDAAAAIKPTPQEIARQSGVPIARRLHEWRLQAIAATPRVGT